MARASALGGKARILDSDPRDMSVSVASQTDAKRKDDLDPLVGWVMERIQAWRTHRQSNYDPRWEEYERLWRGIWSGSEQQRKTERSKIITPALSEAVENAVSEVEEAIFGRGDFFDVKGEARDGFDLKKITDLNKNTLREDLAKTFFVTNVSECLLNSAIYGSGIAELILDEKQEREIVPVPSTDGTFEADVQEKDVTYVCLRSVNPRNFLIDPVARDVDSALGVAIEENVGAHIIYAGMESGDYRTVEIASGPEDSETTADPQTVTPYDKDTIPVIRYYGLVPESLLFPPEKTEKLTEAGLTPSVDPASTKMVEAIVVIARGTVCLKAQTTPYLMRDRPVVAFPWDVVPGRFWGRGVCEKGATPQKLLDAEFRSRMDALAYASAPMMGLDASRLPRGFKMKVYPGRSILTNGDPSTVLKPFKFGELDQNTFQQAQALDQMVQRATGAVDGIAMAQAGAGGDARSGAVSMSMAGIVKRHKRTLMHFVDKFMGPALRKMMWRCMQYGTPRYMPFNFTFNVTSTVGIMQREYESQTLTQMLGAMQPGSPEHYFLLIALFGNTGLANRAQIAEMLMKKAEEAMNPQPPVDPTALAAAQSQQIDPSQQALNQARALEAQARAQKIQAETRTEILEPQFRTQEIATKGIYAAGDNQAREFDRRMKIAKLMLDREEMRSNERIAAGQTQGSIAKAQIGAQAKMATPPAPPPPPAPAPVEAETAVVVNPPGGAPIPARSAMMF